MAQIGDLGIYKNEFDKLKIQLHKLVRCLDGVDLIEVDVEKIYRQISAAMKMTIVLC